ncbi:unnamed protein product [Linum tenue]|uniref:Uncharacterized protein n=1 Tax=Linum tenue TaxID=586396 RepID=A0AAV0GZ89_9ROSI|nr:unnamed protein product [Linum tenue]
MGKGGKITGQRSFKKRGRWKDEGSDDSDEDYVIEHEGNESEEYASSLEVFSSEDEEEEVVKACRRTVQSNNGKTGARKRSRVSYEEDEDEDEDYVNGNDDVDADDDDDDYDGEDEELTLYDEEEEDDDCLDEEEELTANKKKKSSSKVDKMVKRTRTSGSATIMKSRAQKRSTAKNGRKKKRRLRKKMRCDDEDDVDFTDCNSAAREKKSKKTSRKGKYTVNSDSDLVASGSESEYTISEEEREQVREAQKIFGGEMKKTSLRSSSSSSMKTNEEEDDNRDLMAKKGKEKVKEFKKPEVVAKQVCGVCLTEEDKRRLKGTLDCCSHYFCFKCIMEWSKVESRCPLCKQRFTTITKNGRLSLGVDMRSEIIEVPMRDQVYQPTEEEIRSFIDPYESVICTECHEGGDDALMLLCDLCDSPAHTYCVGLGRQVPEGNWYCEGCKPVAYGSSSAQAQDSFPPDQRAVVNRFNRVTMPLGNIFNTPMPMNNRFNRPETLSAEERLLLSSATSSNVAFIRPMPMSNPISRTMEMSNAINELVPMSNQFNRPETLSLRDRMLQSSELPSHSTFSLPISPLAASSPGTGASTVWGRREIQRRIQSLLSSRMEAMPVPNSRVAQHGEMAVQLTNNINPANLSNRSNRLPQSEWRATIEQPSNFVASERPVSLTLWPGEDTRTSLVHGYEQTHLSNNRASIRSDGNLASYEGDSQFYVLKEHLQSMVKGHAKALTQDNELGQENFKQVVRASTHTILAHCGLEHKRNEVHPLPPPPSCAHLDRIFAGQASIMRATKAKA